jgi:hypothetical protein
MKKGRFDRKIEKQVIKMLDHFAAKFSMADVKHAAGKFIKREQVRNFIAKERERLNRRLAEIERAMP